jgi:hypothetical protein
METTAHFIDPNIDYLEWSYHKLHPNVILEQSRNAIIEWANKFKHKLVTNFDNISKNASYYEFDLNKPMYLQTFTLSHKKVEGKDEKKIEYWGDDTIHINRYLYVVTDKELDSEIYFNEMFQLQQN